MFQRDFFMLINHTIQDMSNLYCKIDALVLGFPWMSTFFDGQFELGPVASF